MNGVLTKLSNEDGVSLYQTFVSNFFMTASEAYFSINDIMAEPRPLGEDNINTD